MIREHCYQRCSHWAQPERLLGTLKVEPKARRLLASIVAATRLNAQTPDLFFTHARNMWIITTPLASALTAFFWGACTYSIEQV